MNLSSDINLSRDINAVSPGDWVRLSGYGILSTLPGGHMGMGRLEATSTQSCLVYYPHDDKVVRRSSLSLMAWNPCYLLIGEI